MAIRMLEDQSQFLSAVPVWLRGCEGEKNITCGFYVSVPKAGRAVIRIAAVSEYRLYINDRFVCFGPVRTAKGFHRVDAADITFLLNREVNHIAIEVWNGFVNSFGLVKQPAFVQAEVELDGQIAAYTDPHSGGFAAVRLPQRVQKVQRFSYQRPFAESYRLTPQDNLWQTGDFRFCGTAELTVTGQKKLLPRGLPVHDYAFVPAQILGSGSVCRHAPKHLIKDRSLTNIDDTLEGFPEPELTQHLTDDAQLFHFTENGNDNPLPRQLSQDQYLLLDLQQEKSGFFSLSVECSQPTTLWLLWDELLTKERTVDFLRLATASVIRLELVPGRYDFQSFSVYSARYLQLICSQGCSQVTRLGILEYRYPLPITKHCPAVDPELTKIWQAALESFCQNSSDIFMDCPHRERAGWLCDSYFIGRVEHALTGKCTMEQLHLENFLLPDRFDGLPQGMLPMCYPADSIKGEYIPNWAMWYVLELADYTRRAGDTDLAHRAKQRVYDLIRFFQKYENEFGLLEKLESWVFVEWSKANDLVQDVNFPSNMLYALMLEEAGNLYHDNKLLHQAAQIHSTVCRMSYDGQFFVDNALRMADGSLRLSGERTETCQYYAFYTHTATPETYPALWNILTSQFGPQRTALKLWPEIHPSNAFIGNYLRLELLVRHGLGAQMLEETKDYFAYMAERTGTLWEHINTSASCNHGFASYFIWLLQQIK